MTYAMSDIHGCYDKFAAALEKISFSSNDILYILGDVVDRGPDGIKIILDISKREMSLPFGEITITRPLFFLKILHCRATIREPTNLSEPLKCGLGTGECPPMKAF